MARYNDEEEGIVTKREPGIYSLAEMPPPERGVLGRAYEKTIEPWVEGYQKYIGRPTQRIVGAAAETAYRGVIEPLARDISYIATGKRSFPSTGDLSREVAGRVVTSAQPLGVEDDYATRVEGRTRPSAPVVAPSSLESVWGIGRETLPTGATRYTLPGTEGAMTVEPETAETRLGGEAARRGVISRIGVETAERERGIETQLENEARLREEGIQRQRSEEGVLEQQRRKDLGLEPQEGMAAYEESAKRIREGVIPPKERAAIEVARIGAQSESEKARLASEGVISAAGMKAQTEAAKLGLTAADVKSRIQLRQTQMDKMATEVGLLEPMKLKLQGARDAVAKTKIQRDTYESANKQVYEKTVKGLQDKFNIGQVDAVTYDAELNTLTRSFAARQDMIADTYPMEGQVHSSGVAAFRNGVWVDIEKGKKE